MSEIEALRKEVADLRQLVMQLMGQKINAPQIFPIPNYPHTRGPEWVYRPQDAPLYTSPAINPPWTITCGSEFSIGGKAT